MNGGPYASPPSDAPPPTQAVMNGGPYGAAGPSAYVKTLGENTPSTPQNTPYRSPSADDTGPIARPQKRTKRPPRRLLITIVAAGIAIVLAGGIAILALSHDKAPKKAANCTTTCPQKPNAVPQNPGPKFAYRTVDREVGYFEGTIMVANKTTTPLTKWTLSFTYPGADVHNAWEVALQQTGQYVIINSKPDALPIKPGAEFEVRFGGAGKPSMPTDCKFNGQPCRFTG